MNMISQAVALTVDDIHALALPPGTVLVAGSESAQTAVRWAITIASDSPLPYLEGGELLLLMPGSKDATALIKAALEAGVAGIATVSPLSALALGTAQLARLPVLQLPPGSRLRDVERAVIALLLDRQGNTERRGVQIYQQLIQLAAENNGLERIIHELARLIDKAVIVQDKRFRIQVSAVPPRLAEGWDDLTETLASRDLLPASLQDRHRLPMQAAPTILQAIPGTPFSRLVAPIVNGNVGRGYLSFIAPTGDFTDLDTLVNQHATVVCALEMARAKAISEIEKRLRGDFLDSLMLGNVSETEAVAEGDRFGHTMNAPHVALVVMWQPNNSPKQPSHRRLETLVNGLLSNRPLAVLSRLRDNELRLFYAVETSNPIAAARQLAEDILAEGHREHRDARMAIGIGSLAMRVSEWRASYREAAQAADLAQRLKADTPLYIGDLGIYTFLAHPDYRDDLIALRDSTIGNLIGYEERQRADLLLTLEAFFQAHGNHTQTAELLNVHRNTLTYRMNRIAEITGLDLNQPDVRLAVHLALKVHRLLSAEE